MKWMDGWMGHMMKKLHEKRSRCPSLYVIVSPREAELFLNNVAPLLRT